MYCIYTYASTSIAANRSCRQVEAWVQWLACRHPPCTRCRVVPVHQWCSLRGMALPVSRLVVEKVWSHARQHESFDDLMPMTHAPETGTENPYQKTRKPVPVFCRCVLRIGIDFFPVPFYSVQETVTKMTSTDWSDDRQLCCCLYKLCCLLFYCFKMNWGTE